MCVFCDIAGGGARAEVIHESRTAVAVLERHPVTRGHTLLVARSHVPTLLHLGDGAAGSFLASLVEVSELLAERLRPASLDVGWTQGAQGGGEAPHFHAWIVPRFAQGRPGAGPQEGDVREDLAEVAASIRGQPIGSRRAGAWLRAPGEALGSAARDEP